MAQQTPINAAVADRRTGRLAGEAHALLRRPDFSQRRALGRFALGVRAGAVGLLIWVGYIHWFLWHEGYKYIPASGPFFLVDAIVAIALAALLLAWPRPAVGLASAGLVASTIAALVISLSIGLFGFHESLSAAYVVQALWLEAVDAVLLAAWSVMAMMYVPRGQG
jgi:hypothetical protein